MTQPLHTTPKILSLVPSTTKTICDLGLQEHIVGYTQFCVDPPNLHRGKVCVGGTKDPDINKIIKLAPDIIFMNKEENTKEAYERLKQNLSKTQFQMNQPKSILEAIQEIKNIEEILNIKEPKIHSAQMKANLEVLESFRATKPLKPALYFIWKDPYMVAGTDTYIHDTMKHLGYQNLCKDLRYPKMDSDLLKEDPIILFSNEPYPFRMRDAEEFSQKHNIPKERFYKIDGKLMSWHGTTVKDYLEEAMSLTKQKSTNIFQPMFS